MQTSIIKSKHRFLIQAATVIALLGLWQLLSLKFPSILIPSPLETGAALIKLAESGELLTEIVRSGMRILLGFFVGMLLALLCGLWAGHSEVVYEAFRPITALILGIPPIILVVLAMVWFGTGGIIPIFVISILVFPTFFLNTANGWRAMDVQLLEMARVYRTPYPKVLRHIILPSLAVPIFTAVSLAAGSAVRIGIMAELLGSDSGIGSSLAVARVNIDTAKVFAWTIVSVLIIVLIDYILIHPLKNYTLKWNRKEETE